LGGGMVRAWEVMYSKAAWRVKPDYLSKVSRYQNAGLEIVEEGGELVVKQADGVRVGKLDPNDPYYPNEIKVFGESSKRWFDPDLAGGPIVKRSWQNANITQQGIDDLTTHVARFSDAESVANNQFMIDRLNRIRNGDIPASDISDFDKRFYTHEVEEYKRFQNQGIPDNGYDEAGYQNAHTASLESYSIDEKVLKIYPPDVPFPRYAGYD
jgi:hypothetical protein